MSDTDFVIEVTMPRLLSVKEVAGVLRCSKSQVYNLICAGDLQTVKIAGKIICRAIDVREYIRQCEKVSGLADNAVASTKHSDTSPTVAGSAALSAQRRNRRLMTSSAR